MQEPMKFIDFNMDFLLKSIKSCAMFYVLLNRFIWL